MELESINEKDDLIKKEDSHVLKHSSSRKLTKVGSKKNILNEGVRFSCYSRNEQGIVEMIGLEWSIPRLFIYYLLALLSAGNV